MSKDAYLACPVRGCSPEMRAKLDAYVVAQEATGKQFHYPHRDVNQHASGVEICEEHRTAMAECEEFHLWWTTECVPGMPAPPNATSRVSTGSFFDFGSFYMRAYDKTTKFYLANWDEALDQLHRDSYLALLIHLEAQNNWQDWKHCLDRLARHCFGIDYDLSKRHPMIVDSLAARQPDVFDALSAMAEFGKFPWAHPIGK